MAVHRCTAQEAFEKLVELSQHRNVKVRQIATEFLDPCCRIRAEPAMTDTALVVVDMLNPYRHQDAEQLTASVSGMIEPIASWRPGARARGRRADLRQ